MQADADNLAKLARFLIEGFVADTLSISVENHIDALLALPCHLVVVIVHLSSFSVYSYEDPGSTPSGSD